MFNGVTNFSKTIDCRLTHENLWNLIKQALLNSKNVLCWPNQLESLSADKLQKGAIVNATYHTPSGEYKFIYTIIDFVPGKLIKYHTSEGHIYDGGATIEIVKTKTGSQLKWYGRYKHERISLRVIYLRYYLIPMFFKTLSKGLNSNKVLNKF